MFVMSSLRSLVKVPSFEASDVSEPRIVNDFAGHMRGEWLPPVEWGPNSKDFSRISCQGAAGGHLQQCHPSSTHHGLAHHWHHLTVLNHHHGAKADHFISFHQWKTWFRESADHHYIITLNQQHPASINSQPADQIIIMKPPLAIISHQININ